LWNADSGGPTNLDLPSFTPGMSGFIRYSNRVRLGVDDVERTERVLTGIVGKRLTYRTANL
jgi:hypothetical protein